MANTKPPIISAQKGQPKSLWIAFAWLAGVGFCLSILMGSQLADWLAVPFWLACILLTAGVVLGLPVVMIAILIPLLFIKRWLFQNESFDLTQARKSAKEKGTLVRQGIVTTWFSGTANVMEMLEEQSEDARVRFADYVSEPIEIASPLRIISFAQADQFTAYLRRLGYQFNSMEGVYLLGRPRRIVVSVERPARRLIRIDRLLRVLYGYYFLEQYLGFFPQPWLYLGVGNFLADKQGEEDQAWLRRKMTASLATKTFIEASQFFPIKPRHLLKAYQGKDQHRYFQFTSQFTYQATSITAYLSEKNRKQTFLGFLKDLQKKEPIEPVFIHHFGYGFEQLVENWQAWLKGKGLGRHFPPSNDIQQQLFETIIPLVMDPEVPIMDRIQSIRDMGNAGYVVGADTLIALLHDPDLRIRTVSLWALQNISGLAIGDDVIQWSSWWEHLPADALSAPNSL